MNTVDLSWVLILEAALPFVVLSVLLIITIMAGRKKLKRAAKLLILNVKANEEKEKQAILTFLKDKLAIDEKMAKKNAKKIMNERKFLVRNLVSGILDKNVETIGQLNQDLCSLSNQYHQLEVQAPPLEEADNEPSEEALENEAELKSEIKSLKQEVHITLTTLNNIFKEFSSMFGEDDIPEGEMTVDQIITAMESFSGKNVANDDKHEENVESSEQNDEAPKSELQENVEPEDRSVDTTAKDEELDFSVDNAIDDIDSALDELELGESDADDDEPDWGDAFSESGDEMGDGDR